MYERSAIILERYFNNILGLEDEINLAVIYDDYTNLINKTKKYQEIVENEDSIINQFDQIANNIRRIQQEQREIYKTNIELEEQRTQVFNTLGEEPADVEKKIKKIEQIVTSNNSKLEELREAFVKSLTEFGDKQEERNKVSRTRRKEEKEHIQLIEKCNNDMNLIDSKLIKRVKQFINSENEELQNEIINKMINNGKDEKVPFNEKVMKSAVSVKYPLEKRKAECYIIAYERIKKLLLEISNDDVKLEKYIRALRDISIKLNFLEAQNNYIINFLDNERMTAISGKKVHEKLMSDTCINLERDMQQFENLYKLILEEISGQATIESYELLYNKEYLKKIKEKEETFQREIHSIKINSDAIINSNYWRVEEIKNVYEVFQDEVSEKFNKDLSEFKLLDTEEQHYSEEKVQEQEEKDDIFKTSFDTEEDYLEEDDDYYKKFENEDENDEYDYSSEDEDENNTKLNFEEDNEDKEEYYDNNTEQYDEDNEYGYYYEDDEEDDEYTEYEDDELDYIINKHLKNEDNNKEEEEKKEKIEEKSKKDNKRII